MYQRIIVPIDGSATAAAGLDEAIAMARLTGAELRLMHVLDATAYATGFEPGVVYCSEVIPQMKRAGTRILEAAKARAEAGGVTAEGLLLDTVAGRVCDLVVAQAVSWGADLIVIGTHGRRGVGRFFMGSDAEQVLRMAPVPVLLVRTEGERARTTAQSVVAAKASAAASMAT